MPTATAPQKVSAYRFAAPRATKLGVDRNAGILTGVALITAGLEAKGHGIWIDEKTLSTAEAVLAEKNARMKAAISHLSWADWWDGATDRVMEFPGWFSGCKVVGAQLVAEKLEFYDDFKIDQKRLFNRILEMAEKTPDLFGISLEPWGYLVFVGEDGVEYSERPKDIPLKYDGLPALRVTDLTYGAIVDDPAANPGGFFAQLSRKLSDSELVANLRRFFAAGESSPANAAPAPEKSAAPAAAPASPAPVVNSAASGDALVSSPHMKTVLQHINATFSADKAKHAQALSIFAANPEITVEALAAEMQKQDLAASQAQVTTLTTENTKLKADLAAAEKARDEWKGKFEGIKTSGQPAEVNLGNGGNAGSAVQDNPWAPGSVNLTRQAEITKKDPALAAQLKAAASAPAKKS